MQTLTYGMKIPETGDAGSVFFPALEDNFEQLDIHTHNGTNSPRLTAGSSDAVTQTVAAAGWVATTNGTYRQLLTIPGTLSAFDSVRPSFRNSTGDYLYLNTEKVTSNTYYVYINDNSLTLTAVYTS
jgi:hypothetical protein